VASIGEKLMAVAARLALVEDLKEESVSVI
jgi:hypothetical protein